MASAGMTQRFPRAHVIQKKASGFVEDVVLIQWGMVPGSVDTHWGMGRRIGEWLLEQEAKAGGKIEIAYDYDADFELLGELLKNAGLWDTVRPVVRSVNIDRLTGTIEGEPAKEDSFEQTMRDRCLFRPRG